MRKLNRPCNGQKKLGYKLAGPKGNSQWVPDMQERAIVAEKVDLARSDVICMGRGPLARDLLVGSCSFYRLPWPRRVRNRIA